MRVAMGPRGENDIIHFRGVLQLTKRKIVRIPKDLRVKEELRNKLL
eukprot:CAMPEP_0185793574 /NCGR_PEP_ID=MMETSP1174-20130828/159550_1 /TAXON_ID=35687 /ORGANISM="Dictyocha speculum, Strain CCMP1381" /LENGTH=45 /DNA_ID= /DNA_START= /DNA_END= /DNA_ORIENTATION=